MQILVQIYFAKKDYIFGRTKTDNKKSMSAAAAELPAGGQKTEKKKEKKQKQKHQDEPGPVDLPLGKLIARRWKVIDKLGEVGFHLCNYCSPVHGYREVVERYIL